MSKKEHQYFLIHKPYGILSQFSDEDGNKGLGSIINLKKDIYPVGRLDKDSEGALLLTNDRSVNHQLLNPSKNHVRTYWVEVEGVPREQAIGQLSRGVEINIKGKAHITKPADVTIIQPSLPERDPPVNRTKHPVTSWLAIRLSEGKNRQVRRMTAKVGHPTLRLIRQAIEDLELGNLAPGEMVRLSRNLAYRKLKL